MSTPQEDKIKELKAKVYDFLAQIQFLQNELAKLNQQIGEEFAKLPPPLPTKKPENKPNS